MHSLNIQVQGSFELKEKTIAQRERERALIIFPSFGVGVKRQQGMEYGEWITYLWEVNQWNQKTPNIYGNQ